jgi:hypothetical protein
MQEDFHVTLSSNVSRGNAGNFTTIVPKRYLEGDHWYVGLTEIRFRYSWYNLKKYNKIDIRDKNNKSYSKYIAYLPPGRYDDINDLINIINNLVTEIGDTNKIKKNPSFEVLPHSHKILERRGIANPPAPPSKETPPSKEEQKQIYLDQKPIYLKIHLGNELSEMLGINAYEVKKSDLNIAIKKESQTEIYTSNLSGFYQMGKPELYLPEGKYIYDLSAGISYLMVYSDIVSHSIVGNVMAPLLRVVGVPSNARFGDNIVVTYDKPLYIPVRTRELHSIEIDIKDDTNETIEFKFGHVECGLNFIRKYG